jgi:hypothetical protein
MNPRLLSPLIHVGYCNTGNSWLQKNIFSRADLGFLNLSAKEKSKNSFGLSSSTYLANNFIKKPNGNLYSLGEFLPERIRSLLAECNLPASGVPVISHERFTGHPDTGGFDSDEICSRLAQVLESPKIFIVIREQKSFILSCYLDYLCNGGTRSIQDYMNPTCQRSPRFRKRYFEYPYLISLYQRTFQKENVLVLPFEMFMGEVSEFFKRLFDFAGVKNQELSTIKNDFVDHKDIFIQSKLRCISWLSESDSPYNKHPFYLSKPVGKFINFGRKLLTKVVSDSEEAKELERLQLYIESQIGEWYRESNVKTSELIDLDLSKFNY